MVVLSACRLSVVTRVRVSLVLPRWATRLSCPVSSRLVSLCRWARKVLLFLVTCRSLVDPLVRVVVYLVLRFLVLVVSAWSLACRVPRALTLPWWVVRVALVRLMVVLSCPRLVLVWIWLPVVATRLSPVVASLVEMVLTRVPYRLAPLRVVR